MEELKSKAKAINLTDFDTFFADAKVKLISLINDRNRFNELVAAIANYLAVNPKRFNLRDTFGTLVKFGLQVDTTYDEYQRILRAKIRNKDVLYERLKAARFTKIENPDMNKLENLLVDLRAPVLSRNSRRSQVPAYHTSKAQSNAVSCIEDQRLCLDNFQKIKSLRTRRKRF